MKNPFLPDNPTLIRNSLSAVVILFGICLNFAQALAASYELAINTPLVRSSVADNDVFFVGLENNSSYCCQISAENGVAIPLLKLTQFVPNSGSIENLKARGASGPWVSASSLSADRRQCFQYAKDPDTTNGRSYATFNVEFSGGPPANVTIRCDETTLFGGFNTSVADFNFIEITNTLTKTDSDNDIILHIAGKSVVGGNQVISRSITLVPNQRVDVDIHSVAPSNFGPIVITHNGPKGSIRAVNAQYRLVNTTPLDFEPSLLVPFNERP